VIKYFNNQDINKKKWDRCIDDSVNARIYAYSWYLDIVSPEWSALILDDYQAVFPITSGNKMGIKYCYQAPFTQQLGMFSPLLHTPQMLDSFLKKLSESFPLIQINLNSYNKTSVYKETISSKINHELDLIASYDNIRKSYSKNLKRNIKKAQKTDLTIFENLKPEAVIDLFRANKGKEIKGLSDNDYQKLNHLIYKALSINKVEVWGIYTPENNLCAAAVLMKDHKRFTFLFSATNQEAKDTGAMPFLIDSFIQQHSEEKKIFDFEGSNDENLARFYKSFGSAVVHYPHFFQNNLSWHFSILWKLKQWIK